MTKQHQVKMSIKKYPGGLRFFECETCSYAFAAEVNAHDVLLYDTKETINYGNLEAAHTIFQIPNDSLTLSMSALSSEKPEYDF